MEALALALVLIVGGIYFGARNLRFLRNEEALRAYMQTSLKGTIWVRKYGMDGATNLVRRVFIPVGLVVSGILVGVGASTLWRLYA